MYVKYTQLLLWKVYLQLHKHNCLIILFFSYNNRTQNLDSKDWDLNAASTPGIRKWREQSSPAQFTPQIAKMDK